MSTTKTGHPLITGLSNVKTSPKWSFGGRGNHLSSLNTPGPGSYANGGPEVTSKFTKSARFGFGTAQRSTAYEKQVPGPGSYGHKGVIGQEGPAFTIVSRRENALDNTKKKDMPGPGAHNLPDLVGKTGPAYTGTPRRPEAAPTVVPGPGAYNQEDSVISDGKPKWGFGTAQRPGIEKKGGETPGPGTYAQGGLMGKLSPQYSMQARREAAKTTQTPGPGTHGGSFTQFGY